MSLPTYTHFAANYDFIVSVSSPLVVTIPRAKNKKLKFKVSVAVANLGLLEGVTLETRRELRGLNLGRILCICESGRGHN